MFARAAPEAKLRIADAVHAHGQVVAMIGDGVDDAPALHHADIGVAMGRSGIEVAREAATMVLTDDNVATVVAGVEEGRRVDDNGIAFELLFAAAAVYLPPMQLVFGTAALPLWVLGRCRCRCSCGGSTRPTARCAAGRPGRVRAGRSS